MNFGGLEKKYAKAQGALFSVIPVPYDLTSTYGSGCRRGPSAMLEASSNMELYDEHLCQSTYLVGIHTAEALAVDARGPKEMVASVYRRTKEHFKAGRIPVIIGGEHSISFGSMKAAYDFYPDLSVLHLDAHADLRDSYQSSPFSHASVARRMLELSPVVQVGIRSISKEEAVFMRNAKQLKTFFAEDIRAGTSWRADVINELRRDVYITLDLDVFDPAIMPATGTPEPNGLLWRDVLPLLEDVARERRVVGFDVVELSPIAGMVAPDFLAAKLIYSMMGFVSKHR